VSLLAVVTLFALAPRPALAAASITVDTISDEDISDSELSIREAILLANDGIGASGLNRALSVGEADNVTGTPGAASVDTITFSDPPFAVGTPGVVTIDPAVLPPLLGGSDIIDGTGRGVILDGAGEPSGFNCLNVDSNSNVVKGIQVTDCASGILLVSGNTGNTVGPGNTIYDNTFGVAVVGNSNTVKGNMIGTTVDGTNVHPDGGNLTGVNITGDSNTIGGSNIADRNIISGSTSGGVLIDSLAGGNMIHGNYIGTDVSGALDKGNGGNGVFISGDGNFVGGTIAGAGNVISGNNVQGVSIGSGGASNRVEGNIIGLDATGNAAIGNSLEGVQISGAGATLNVVGGTDPAARNIISGNIQNGVSIAGVGTSGNTVQGNYIGTDITGTLDRGNGNNGVSLGGSVGNTIGGTAAGAGNVISGNARGFLITGSSNFVQGNLIGTNAAGTSGLGNTVEGLSISGSSNTIGGSAPGAGNVISGNGASGFNIAGTGNTVQANYIGTLADGVTALGNALDGVRVANSTNTIGGATEETGSTIAYNGGDGVSVPSGIQNAIRSNIIHSNAGLGIDLGVNGVTANDNNTGDADVGANNQQNFPALTGVALGVADVTIDGTLDSALSTSFDIDFFSSPSCDASGNGEGAAYLGTFSDTTDGSGDLTFSVLLPVVVPAARFITASATDPLGNTSEFSACIASLDDADDDNDGFTDSAEGSIGTNAWDPCGNDGWPADLVGNNILNIADFNSFTVPAGANDGHGTFNYFGHPVPDAGRANEERWNLHVDGTINIADLNALSPGVNSPTSRPPMFGGQPAFFTNGGQCPYPP
jgi:hypothetical protein